jgi:molybdopterin synthase catalytic subunit
VDEHRLIALRAEHSHGLVPTGQCSFRLQITSAHRGEGLAAMDEFITRMKRQVPIWKIPKWR